MALSLLRSGVAGGSPFLTSLAVAYFNLCPWPAWGFRWSRKEEETVAGGGGGERGDKAGSIRTVIKILCDQA